MTNKGEVRSVPRSMAGGAGTVSRELHELARLHGVQTSYLDVTGVRRYAPADSLVAVIGALGGDLDGAGKVGDALRRRRRDLATRTLPPVAVIWDGEKSEVPVTVPRHAARGVIPMRIRLETGDPIGGTLDLATLPVRRAREIEGVPMVTLGVPLPPGLPPGYHRLSLELGGDEGRCLIISAPRLAYVPDHRDHQRLWGVFLPLYSLHSRRSMGAGDYGDLISLIEWVGDLGGDTVGTLPLLATFLDEPYEPSPYAPVSRRFWNEFYIDLGRVPELTEDAVARRILREKAVDVEIDRLRESGEVDYRAQMALKRRVLSRLADGFFTRSSSRREEFERFLSRNPDVEDYALFRAVCDRQRQGWPAWPARLRDGTITSDDYDPTDHRYHRYAQWVASEQMDQVAGAARRYGPGFYVDLPVGTHPDGFDTWRERALYTRRINVGSPPDPLAPDGQDWGFPALQPEANREDHYRHVIQFLRHHMRAAGALRIDHVMGLHRLFWTPQAMPTRDGVYVRYHDEELYAIVCLESQRNRCLIVGEDLGTVPHYVRPAMASHRFFRMNVTQAEIWDDPATALGRVAESFVTSVNTHDMPPFDAFWNGKDIKDWVALGRLTPDQAREETRSRERMRRKVEEYLRRTGRLQGPATTQSVFRSCVLGQAAGDARLQIINLEDLWQEDRPQNVPGTHHEQPNWRRRARLSIEEVKGMAEIRNLLTDVDRHRRDGGGNGANPGPPSVIASAGPLPGIDDIRLTPDDLHLFNEGNHFKLYEKLGAHACIGDGGVTGIHFAVWAPNARSVSVVASFNDYAPNATPLQPLGSSGIWQAFVPGQEPGVHYKFHIVSNHHGHVSVKADPFAFHAEVPPKSASVVCPLDYDWRDQEWMASRRHRQAHDAAISVYEMHLGSWMRVPEEGNRPLTYRELAPRLCEYVKRMGFTHVELMPIMEHPFDGSWGYQITGFFAPTSRYGLPQDFMYLVDQLHQAGVGVILDWVPSHFPTDGHGLGYFDGTHLFEHADPRKGFHPDWSSYIFNYGRHEVRSFLFSSAMYWLDRYHIDGLRVDAVASMLYLDYSRKEGEWIPNQYGGKENIDAIDFLRRLNVEVGKHFPEALMIAEESTAWPMVSRPAHVGGLGFDFKWDMGWMHDTLRFFSKDPIHRSFHHNDLTFRLLYASTENFMLSLSHDEVVHGKASLLSKMPGDPWQKFANLRSLYGYMFGMSGKKLLFMGGEMAEWHEWWNGRQLDWPLENEPLHAGMQRWVSDLNHLMRSEPALHQLDSEPGGFEWVDCHDFHNSTLAFLRRARNRDDVVLVLCNFTPVPREGFRVGVPRPGLWRVLLNGDAGFYGGSDFPTRAEAWTQDIPWHERPCSIEINLPPLSVMFLKGPGS